MRIDFCADDWNEQIVALAASGVDGEMIDSLVLISAQQGAFCCFYDIFYTNINHLLTLPFFFLYFIFFIYCCSRGIILRPANDRFHDSPLRKRLRLSRNLLRIFVSLPGEDENIARPHLPHAVTDGLFAVTNHHIIACYA